MMKGRPPEGTPDPPSGSVAAEAADTTHQPPLRPPAICVRVELDAPPVVFLDCATDRDEAQLTAWLETQPRSLLALSVLAEEARRGRRP